MHRVGQNHINIRCFHGIFCKDISKHTIIYGHIRSYTVFSRYVLQGYQQIYGHMRHVYTVLANPKLLQSCAAVTVRSIPADACKVLVLRFLIGFPPAQRNQMSIKTRAQNNPARKRVSLLNDQSQTMSCTLYDTVLITPISYTHKTCYTHIPSMHHAIQAASTHTQTHTRTHAQVHTCSLNSTTTTHTIQVGPHPSQTGQLVLCLCKLHLHSVRCNVNVCVCVCCLDQYSALCVMLRCAMVHIRSVCGAVVCVCVCFLKCCLDQYSAHCVMLRCAIVRIHSVCGAVGCVCVLEMLSGPIKCTFCHVAVCNSAHTLSVWCSGVCVCVFEMLSGPIQCTLCHVAVCNSAHTLSVWCRGVCVCS